MIGNVPAIVCSPGRRLQRWVVSCVGYWSSVEYLIPSVNPVSVLRYVYFTDNNAFVDHGFAHV